MRNGGSNGIELKQPLSHCMQDSYISEISLQEKKICQTTKTASLPFLSYIQCQDPLPLCSLLSDELVDNQMVMMTPNYGIFSS